MGTATPRVRGTAIVAVGVLALAIGGLYWGLRDSANPTSASGSSQPVRTTSATSPAAAPSAAEHPASAAAPPAPAGTAEVDEDGTPRPQPVPLDPSAKPPSLDAPHSKPAPPQQPFTRDETIAKREADLKLLDDTKTRLESDLAAAKTANDASAAHELEVRIARLTELRKKRSTELDAIRAGGALPQ